MLRFGAIAQPTSNASRWQSTTTTFLVSLQPSHQVSHPSGLAIWHSDRINLRLRISAANVTLPASGDTRNHTKASILPPWASRHNCRYVYVSIGPCDRDSIFTSLRWRSWASGAILPGARHWAAVTTSQQRPSQHLLCGTRRESFRMPSKYPKSHTLTLSFPEPPPAYPSPTAIRPKPLRRRQDRCAPLPHTHTDPHSRGLAIGGRYKSHWSCKFPTCLQSLGLRAHNASLRWKSS